jgi:hypothetical protein
VLDLLITQHLYATHTDVDPGELTDLRSALVSNENFAQAVVRNNIHSHLQHGSGILLEQVTEYVRSSLEYHGKENEFVQQATFKAPKVRKLSSTSVCGLTAYFTLLSFYIFEGITWSSPSYSQLIIVLSLFVQCLSLLLSKVELSKANSMDTN